MSCGKHHATPCTEVLDHLYEYIDGELGDDDCVAFRQHLRECGPCLREFGLEEAVKALVRRSCTESAPQELRTKVLWKLEQVRVEISLAEG